MKPFVSVFVTIFFGIVFAQNDPYANWFLNLRDSKKLTISEQGQWSRATCDGKPSAFSWQGCKVASYDSTTAIVLNGIFFKPYSVLLGNFSAPNMREALVAFTRQETECCIVHDVLFRYINGQYRPIEVYDALLSTGCLKIQLTSRRDALSCATQSTQGLYGNMQSYSTLFSTTLFQGTEKTIINFSFVNYNPHCFESEIMQAVAPFQSAEIRSWNRSDENRDGLSDLVVNLIEKNWQSLTNSAACNEIPVKTSHKLIFFATDRGLAPSDQTRTMIKKLMLKYKKRN
jgi:hypothetical protein